MRKLALIVAILTGAVAAQASTTYKYDGYVTPNTLPMFIPSSPWTMNGAYDAIDTETSTGALLTLHAANDVTAGPYYTANPVATSTDEYEIRSRVRVPSSGGPSGTALYQAYIGDGTKLVGFGVTNISANVNAIYLISLSLAPLTTPYIATLTNDDFFNIRLVKQGTSGGAGDTVQLYVDGTLASSVSYSTMSAYAFPELLFGASGSLPFGTIELTGASFGIGAAAPALIPEPSSVALACAGVALLFARRRKS